MASRRLKSDHLAKFQAKPLGLVPRPGLGVKSSTQKHRAFSAVWVEWTLFCSPDMPTLAGMWPSIHSFIQETRPSILGQAVCWELARGPFNGESLGLSPPGVGGRGLCHESLVGVCEQFTEGSLGAHSLGKREKLQEGGASAPET